jgi:heme o synthase
MVGSKTSRQKSKQGIKTYLLLAKPGIIMGNIFTLFAGFWLASRQGFDLLLLLRTIFGFSLVVASASIWNNYIDRHIDALMERTEKRAFVKKEVSVPIALTTASICIVSGYFTLFFFVSHFAAFAAFFGFAVYVFIYSFSKTKTSHGTVIGSLAGAMPPVIGYFAVKEAVTIEAVLLFLLLIFWQMPHFYAIALFRMKDYKAASVPVLPVIKEFKIVKRQMVIYITIFTAVVYSLFHFEVVGFYYFSLASMLSLIWLIWAVKGPIKDKTESWGRQMFFLSLIVICALSAFMPVLN